MVCLLAGVIAFTDLFYTLQVIDVALPCLLGGGCKVEQAAGVLVVDANGGTSTLDLLLFLSVHNIAD